MINLVFLASALAAAPADSVRAIDALQLTADRAAPVIDGRLDDAVWQMAQSATDFVQMMPNPGAPSSQRTEARLVYGTDAIYVAMRMFDTHPDSIATQLARRDAIGIYSDWAHVVLDSYHDRRTAFRFSVNPSGVKKDVFHHGDTREDLRWDAIWEVATQRDEQGWTAEFRIPLSQLRFSPRDGAQVWGVNFGREIARRDERSNWSPVLPNTGRYVSSAGELRGLRDLKAPRRLEVQPYSVGKLSRAPRQPGNPFYERNATAASVGADVKYGLTSDLTLTATLNPDFGQVEADPSEVNLTAFESFFRERRPFFVEGMDIFSFDAGQVDPQGGETLFYSRRIGRSPQRRVSVDGFVDAPEASRILGAGKISGKTKSGWSIGVLNAVTGQEEARVFTAGGQSRVAVEPLSNYGMARVSRDFRRGQSAIGAVLTTTHRDIEEGSGLEFLRSSAYAGGADGRHRFGGGKYEVSGFLLGSRIAGSRRSMQLAQLASARYFQRPDASHVEYDSTRTSLEGVSAQVELSKIGGGNWRWGVTAVTRSPGFEINDLGYLRTADASTVLGQVGYNQFEPSKRFRFWNLGLMGGSGWTYGGERNFGGIGTQGSFQLQNFWGGGGALIRIVPTLSPVALRGGPALYTPPQVLSFFGVNGDQRRKARLGMNGSLQREDGTGSYSWHLSPSVTVRSSAQSELSVGPMLSRNVTAWQFLGRQQVQGQTRYVGGHLDQTTVALTLRGSYTFTPDLSFQLYAQPFVSAGDYSDFREVGEARAETFGERFRPIPDSRIRSNPDFNVLQMRSNAVVRWEYRPGSTLFVVWSQTRNGFHQDGGFGLGRDFGRLLNLGADDPTKATNVLLIKASYWLDF